MAGTAATWALALTNGMGNWNSPVRIQPITLFSGKTATTAAPTDATPPPTTANLAGDGATADVLGSWTPPLGSLRCDGFRQISLSLEAFGSAGSVSATFRAYFFDGVRWCQCADTIVVTTTQTTSNPLARQRHDIYVENDFGFCLVLEAITGTGATAAAYAALRDLIIGQR